MRRGFYSESKATLLGRTKELFKTDICRDCGEGQTRRISSSFSPLMSLFLKFGQTQFAIWREKHGPMWRKQVFVWFVEKDRKVRFCLLLDFTSNELLFVICIFPLFCYNNLNFLQHKPLRMSQPRLR